MPTIWSKITGVVASSPSFIPLLCVGWAGTRNPGSPRTPRTLASHTWGLPHPEVARPVSPEANQSEGNWGRGVEGFQGQCLLLRTGECVV